MYFFSSYIMLVAINMHASFSTTFLLNTLCLHAIYMVSKPSLASRINSLHKPQSRPYQFSYINYSQLQMPEQHCLQQAQLMYRIHIMSLAIRKSYFFEFDRLNHDLYLRRLTTPLYSSKLHLTTFVTAPFRLTTSIPTIFETSKVEDHN